MIAFATTDDEIRDCYAVMSELRPHLAPEEFVSRVRSQMESFGYRLVCLRDGDVHAVGGIRVSECLAGGRYMEIDDLVAREGERSKGYGGQLFDWIVDLARKENCEEVNLISRVTRFGAHRFYLRKRMDIEAHYFSMKL